MWHNLRLESLGVIAEAELEFGPGFTVITGETGAGKTMLVTALGLLRGQRATTGIIRTGSMRSRVEATIAAADPEVREIVSEAGGEVDDEVILGRIVHQTGRSRALAGGATVPAGLLSRMTDRLVAVHGQADQQRLVQPDQQRQALDRYAGDAVRETLEQFQPAWAELRELRAQRESWHATAEERVRRLEMLHHGLREIDDVAPSNDEDDDLLAEENRLAHAESLSVAAMTAATVLADDENNVVQLLTQVLGQLDATAGHDPELDTLARRLRETVIEATDIASELHRYGSTIEMDPQRLAYVQQRRSDLTALQRRYGPSLAEVLSWAEEARQEVARYDLDDSSLDELNARIDELDATVTTLANRLSDERRAAATRLSEAVEAELAALALTHAKLTIEITDDELSAHGADRIRFLFAANSGSVARPLGEGASGGELSRLMLAIEVVLADRSPVPTLVFDEVDAGIGGRTAVEVGRRLARLAEHAQIIAVTHLPQVAAFADSHYVVTKNDDGDVTHSSVRQVGGEERIDELARMLSGLDSSDTAQAHARELLRTAQS